MTMRRLHDRHYRARRPAVQTIAVLDVDSFCHNLTRDQIYDLTGFGLNQMAPERILECMLDSMDPRDIQSLRTMLECHPH